MMYKKNIFTTNYIIVFILILGFYFPKYKVYADSNDRALIIYENEKVFSHNENIVNHLNELLYVFNKEVNKVNINEYESGYIESFSSVFVINIRNDLKNKYLLNDLDNYDNKIYWIGDKIEDLLNHTDKYGISYDGKNNNIVDLIYRDKTLRIKESYLFNIVKHSSSSKILASMSDGYNTYPYIINEKNLYYISRWNLDNNFIFEDSLNDFYEIKKFKKGKVFVKIEDVHPLRDTKKLKEISDYLYSNNIPFMIALIPTYIDSKTNVINTLDSKPEFIETIKYMQDKGGSVVLHGYNHQMDDEVVREEGYEFEDIKTYIKNRVLSGLRLCIENEIYPIAFEASHYAIDENGYKEIKKYFSTYVGQYQNNNDCFTTARFPYIIKNSDNFNIFIPENLGYIESNDLFAVDKIKENFEKLSMVRGYSGGFFFQPDLDINYLKESIEYLKNQNVEFMDLKNNENYVKVDDISITSKDGEIQCSYNKSKSITKNKEESKFEVFMKNLNNIVITFIFIVLILFVIIFIVFKKINTNKFKRR